MRSGKASASFPRTASSRRCFFSRQCEAIFRSLRSTVSSVPGIFLDERKERAALDRFRKSMKIRMAGPEQQISNLSGGNQQKIVLARWLALGPRFSLSTSRPAVSTLLQRQRCTNSSMRLPSRVSPSLRSHRSCPRCWRSQIGSSRCVRDGSRGMFSPPEPPRSTS